MKQYTITLPLELNHIEFYADDSIGLYVCDVEFIYDVNQYGKNSEYPVEDGLMKWGYFKYVERSGNIRMVADGEIIAVPDLLLDYAVYLFDYNKSIIEEKLTEKLN